jgi:tRNA pseudouridine13 synthase
VPQYLTRDFAGIGGTLKSRPEDFFVQEIPLYEPSGQGEHVYCEIQKANLTTFDAVDRIAHALGISPRDIGYAGMKDARAVSRQTLSIFGTTPEAVMALKLPEISILWASRHTNKLRLGHLSGNRFAIKIRDVNPTDVVRLRPVIDTIEKRGMPNYFGEQRFGRRGDNAALGAALIRDDPADLLHHLLGRPDPAADDSQSLGARAAFDSGEHEKAMKLLPRRCGMERRILARLIKTQNPAAAARAIDQRLRRLWVSALQSEVFNRIVARRIDSLDRLMDGDLACKHDSGGIFLVESAAAEQARCERFEISPTGPLVGYRMRLPEGEPGTIEQAILVELNLTPADFRRAGRHKIKGTRRPLRVQPRDIQLEGGVDEHGPHITVAFSLPAGSYATVLLRELMKSDESENELTPPPPFPESESPPPES